MVFVAAPSKINLVYFTIDPKVGANRRCDSVLQQSCETRIKEEFGEKNPFAWKTHLGSDFGQIVIPECVILRLFHHCSEQIYWQPSDPT